MNCLAMRESLPARHVPCSSEKLMYKFICRLNASHNFIIMLLSNTRSCSVQYQSPMQKHRYDVVSLPDKCMVTGDNKPWSLHISDANTKLLNTVLLKVVFVE